jgi:hypothetical protein
MFQMVTKIIKRVSIPVLLIASIFSRYAASYEFLVDLVICLGAIILVQQAVRLKKYFWAAGFVAIALVFSPLPLVVKIFLLMGLTCAATFATLLTAFRTQPRSNREVRAVMILALLAAIPVAGMAQTPVAGIAQTADVLDWKGRLHYHAEKTYAPLAIVGFAAYAGVLQGLNAPEEWGQGGAAYGKRVASTAGWSAIHGALAFGLDSTLHQDPRYYRSLSTGFWRRTGHALRGTILTRTDAGGETFSTWRVGSAYGSAVLSNLWYPDRLNTARLGLIQGSVGLGFDLAGNLGSEFWPDIKRKVFRRK